MSVLFVCRGLKIIREADDYYLVHQGEIQRYLGSKRQREGENGSILSVKAKLAGDRSPEDEESCQGLLDKILFFIGDLEVASTDAKRARAL
uniref:Uncharacterized protein LOC107408106 n=1 Tax=Rhizophora mucronata TaxID=61149 RepID=A0A2P2K715_RHIMU